MAISRAMTAGGRKGVMSTLGPNLRRRVRAATAAMVVMGSGTGRGEESRSENHTESMPVRSQRSMNRHRKSRPSAPAGHTPGITPIRYLMSMAANVARTVGAPGMLGRVQAASLDARFGVPGLVKFEPGPGGLTRAVVTTAVAGAHVYLHGAHVAHFQPASALPALFLSPRSAFAQGRAIRGGVPVIFPWFGPNPDDPRAPDHGFARTAEWQVEWVETAHDSVSIALGLETTEATRAAWPHAFRLRYRISIGTALDLALTVENRSSAAFVFQEALHTYLHVGDVEAASVAGLEHTAYIDKADGMARKSQGGGPVRLRGLTDRV